MCVKIRRSYSMYGSIGELLSLFFLLLPPLLLVGFYDAEISRRPPFKYRRETFSAPSRISRAMSDSRRERKREKKRGRGSHDDHRDKIYYMFPT